MDDISLIEEERAKLEQLLVGACKKLESTAAKHPSTLVTWPLGLLDWWDAHPACLASKAKAAALAVSDEEYAALQDYIIKHGHMPER